MAAILQARNIRWNRDLSFYQDSELSRAEYQKIDALLKHLLVGHDGKPCPSGDRPIIRPGGAIPKNGRGAFWRLHPRLLCLPLRISANSRNAS